MCTGHECCFTSSETISSNNNKFEKSFYQEALLFLYWSENICLRTGYYCLTGVKCIKAIFSGRHFICVGLPVSLCICNFFFGKTSGRIEGYNSESPNSNRDRNRTTIIDFYLLNIAENRE